MYKRKEGGNRSTFLISSSDLDVLQTAQKITDMGTISKAGTPKAEHHKQMYQWQVYKPADLIAVIDAILPHLHSRRVGQLQIVRNWCQDRIDNPRQGRRIAWQLEHGLSRPD